MITETDEVAAALDDAAHHWPDENSRGKLLLRLIKEGHHAVRRAEARGNRLAAIERHTGALSDAYGPDYLADLRAEWPA